MTNQEHYANTHDGDDVTALLLNAQFYEKQYTLTSAVKSQV